jgi:hypothetical protein
MSPQLRWLWFEHADSVRSALHLVTRVGASSKAFFHASIICLVGNRESTLFWDDPWFDGRCIAALAPDLVEVVSQRCRRRRTVQALNGTT